MVTETELGYKPGEVEVRENAPYRVLRPQFETVISPAEVLRKRFDELNAFAQKYEGQRWTCENFEHKRPWHMLFFNTSMGAAGTLKELILNPHSEALRAITPKTKLVDHGVPLVEIPPTVRRYNRADYAQFINRRLCESEVATNPFWLELAENDADFLGKLAQLMFKVMKDVYGHDDGFGMYFPEDTRLIERSLLLTYVSPTVMTNASGCAGLDLCARFVGVVTKCSERSKETVVTVCREEGASEASPVAVLSPRVMPVAGELERTVAALMKKHGIETAEEAEKAFALYSAAKKLNIK